ncbi:type I polyketide synthase [Thalassomonas viridans]|uniref:Type I polyketide synthase n=1 Tax=Thalassomonas viridans TaxID=137584 RepID=A0AAE9Z3D8_9GAMM|nr:type I polyketide synthase [Thalassomonas viridans]WDE05304.1 type I polyketide synthase [Thalassomonas viridans]
MTELNTAQNIDEDIADSIAIIGLAGRFPKAESIAALWQMLCAGESGISIEARETDPEGWVPATANLENPGHFDADFFKLSPRDAAVIDPQQRCFLEVCHQALENAGYAPRQTQGKVGVYAGVSPSQYLFGSVLEDVNNHNALTLLNGSLPDQMATRVAWHLNLKGPAMTLATACSTSLVALSVAVQQLEGYHCDMALVGGSCLQLDEEDGYQHVEGGIFSQDGKCRPFDDDASGTVSGSGVAAVLLKRTAEALEDGDNIIAVIRSTALNNDGNEKIGYSAPSEQAQSDVIAEALTAAELSAQQIKYVEAHGTATRLGDPIELRALTQAYRDLDAGDGQTYLGSLKTNLGHLDAAAGITGLIKTALVLKHQLVPPMPLFRQANREFDLDASPFKVNNSLQELESSEEPLLAAVSSFGIGGTNAHVILQQAPKHGLESRETRKWQFFPVSAKNEAALAEQKSQLKTALVETGAEPADISKTLVFGRDKYECRSALVGDGQNLGAIDDARENKGGKIAFIFPGQGSQYRQMAYGLYREEAVFRRYFDEIAGYAGENQLDLAELVFHGSDDLLLAQTENTQPALFAVEYSLAKLLEHYGIKADAYLGHSLGEWVAATLSGVFSLRDAVYAVIRRGKLMASMARGQMLSVPASWQDIADLLPDTLDLAVENTKTSCVLSGENAAIEEARAILAEEGLTPKLLRTSHAYHSRMMTPVLAPFAEFLAGITFHPATTPWLSNVTGDWMDADQVATADYWCRHIRNTVLFADGLQRLQDENYICLELGPGQSFSRLLSSGGYPHTAAFMRPAKSALDDNQQFTRGMAELWVMGVEPDWSTWFSALEFNRISLPTYPFQRQEYWWGERKQKKLSVPKAELESPKSREVQSSADTLLLSVVDVFNKHFARRDIQESDNFFDLGGDSLLSISVLHDINHLAEVKITMEQFLASPEPEAIARLLEREAPETDSGGQDSLASLNLPAELQPVSATGNQAVDAVLVTGATGFWGIHLIHELLAETEQQVVCLIRAEDLNQARYKLQQKSQQYRLELVAHHPRLQVVLGDIALPDFGLDAEAFAALARSVGRIYHLGASVNHLYGYQALKAANVDSVLTCLKLAGCGRRKQLVFASSIAVYSNSAYLAESRVSEQAQLKNGEFSSGYGQSKWAAEQLIWQAEARGFDVLVLRAGNITGHSRIGLCSEKDALWALVKACLLLNAYPQEAGHMRVDMLPVDLVCRATRVLAESGTGQGIFHLVPEKHFTFDDLIVVLKDLGYPLQRLDIASWGERARSELTSEQARPLYRILEKEEDEAEVNKELAFDNRSLVAELDRLGLDAPQLTRGILTNYINQFIRGGFFPGAVVQGAKDVSGPVAELTEKE